MEAPENPEETMKRTPEITKDLAKKIAKAVEKILDEGSLYEWTERKVRDQASADLDLNLSEEPYKSFFSQRIELYLEECREDPQKRKDRAQRRRDRAKKH